MIRRKLVNRRNRRKSDPSNVAPRTQITATVSSSGTTNITIDFDQPVVVNGTLGITVATRTIVSQTVVSSTQITLVASGNVAGLDWAIPANDPAVRNSTGGYVAPAAGTFP